MSLCGKTKNLQKLNPSKVKYSPKSCLSDVEGRMVSIKIKKKILPLSAHRVWKNKSYPSYSRSSDQII